MLDSYYRELLNFLTRATGSRHRAEDVAQDVYLKVLNLQSPRRANGGASVRSPRALLYAAARNLLIDGHRREQARPPLDEIDANLAAPAHCEPERRLAARQQLALLEQAIAALPPRCRQAFVLFKLDGLSQAEIAAEMGISRNMVEKHIINGMLACKRALEREGER
ncbi:RNA polymerase subunit sigma-24 [Chromobacterium phragmitis]|uniref:RNA polymerase subunit sigma-24 n=1 Tax=Chromobacterium phragmitis TaxID=2202141 RepID=A0A344UK16_9NEIS|nr:sigma-70 family RNA polymerase sigma factor [Chromobacterium phragmitis]AXE30220.1 RNA polymerase subunit sigma-24 [Chromobacterium phragmitis]AXE35614.1 RNA polymerase subunit sigma-24 [Chromobacterium phragmitis]